MRTARTPYEMLAAVLPRLYALTPIEDFPQHVAEVMLAAVSGDKCDYTEIDRRNGDFRVLVWPEPPQLRALDEARRTVMAQHPALSHFIRRSTAPAVQLSDFYTAVEYRRLPLYGEFFGPLGVEDQLTAAITPPDAARAAAISIDRESRSFTDGDRIVLELLRPHLARAHRNAEAYSSALRTGRRPQVDQRLARLTPREREVLSHLGSGRSNVEIAERLTISPDTVRKHVEHILAGLGVHSRTSAAVLFALADVEAPEGAWTAQIPAMVADGPAPSNEPGLTDARTPPPG